MCALQHDAVYDDSNLMSACYAFESLDAIKLQKMAMQQVVDNHYMPLGNITNITTEERDITMG